MYKLLRRIPGAVCCHLVPEEVCFNPSHLMPEIEKESIHAIISWVVASFSMILKYTIKVVVFKSNYFLHVYVQVSVDDRLKQLQEAHRDFGPSSQHFLSSKY